MSRYFGKPFYKVYRLYQEPDDYFWIKNETQNTITIQINKNNGTPSSHPQYSKDLVNWTDFIREEYWSDEIELEAGQKVYFRSKDGFNEENKYWYLNTYNNVSTGGNLATLVNWMGKDNVTRFPDFFFQNFFSNNAEYLIDASELTTGNVSVAGRGSFYYTFLNTSITSLGDWSSITELENSSFHWTFMQCGNLTTGLDLSNVTTLGYDSMLGMYQNCYKLSQVTAPNVSEWNTDYTQNWLNSAGTQATNKTAYVPDGVTIPQDESGVPYSWTRVTY